jgi:hypothetical protein
MTTLIKSPLYHPATHMRGIKCNYIFGSKSLLQGDIQSGISPFPSTTCKNSNHISLFIDIDQVWLLGANMQSQFSSPIRKIVCTSPTLIKKFIQAIQNNNKPGKNKPLPMTNCKTNQAAIWLLTIIVTVQRGWPAPLVNNWV